MDQDKCKISISCPYVQSLLDLNLHTRWITLIFPLISEPRTKYEPRIWNKPPLWIGGGGGGGPITPNYMFDKQDYFPVWKVTRNYMFDKQDYFPVWKVTRYLLRQQLLLWWYLQQQRVRVRVMIWVFGSG